MEAEEDIVKTIQCNQTEITLVGTAHVSKQSVRTVEEKLSKGYYDCVAVELCPARHENLVKRSWWKNLDIYQVFRQKKGTLLLVNMALSAYQRRLADKLGIEPGKEMLRAVELAEEKNIRLEMIDRDISTTLQRVIRKVSFWQKFKIFSGLVVGVFVGEEIDEEQIEKLKQGDMLHSMVEAFGEELPMVKEVLIDERDQYMTGKLALLVNFVSGSHRRWRRFSGGGM